MSVLIVGTSPTFAIKRAQSHTHMAWEIVLNLQGNGFSTIGNAIYPFKSGTIICQPPNVAHSKISEERFTDIYIQSEEFPISKAGDENGVLVFQDDHSQSYETPIFLAYRAFHKKEPNYRLLVDSLYEAMNHLLVGWLYGNPLDDDIERIKNRMINSFSDPEFTVSELWADAQYCNDHLRRRFKRATGMTLMEYLTELRMNFAKKLMRENKILNYTIHEIAFMSGYYDSRYFSRVFRKKNGMSPMEFLNTLNKRR